MKSSQVRDLARRYAAGQLSQENYRSQRRALIDSVAQGGEALVYKEMAVRLPGKRARLKLAAAAVVAVLLAAIAVKLTWKATHPARQAADKTAPGTFVPPPLPAPGPDLVRGFVETNDWTDTSLESLAHRWQTLSAEDQGKARESTMYPQLVSELRQQITSEKALMAGANGPDAHLMELNKVAKDLAIPASP